MRIRSTCALALLGLLTLFLAAPRAAAVPSAEIVPALSSVVNAGSAGLAESAHEWHPPRWSAIPFVLMLLCIAVIPLINAHWWENDRHRGLISLLLGLPTLVYVWLAAGDGPGRIQHQAIDYVSFIILLGSLYMISGGIVITGNLRGTPVINTAFLAAGGLMASFIGTTGAAMLLIRPVLNTNRERKRILHTVIFFIFIVCNCGGCLTPLGDPPLFLGYLKGIPFTWTFTLWKDWLVMCGLLLAIYFVFDSYQHARETPSDIKADVEHDRPLVVLGAHNFLFLGGVIAAVALTNVFTFPTREGFMVLMVLLAWFSTRPKNRQTNRFSFGPIREVAVVFAGIFSTMIPALALLNAEGAQMGLKTPEGFFWATGVLSSFLDNAPTYLSFLAMATGITDWPPELMADCLGVAGPQHAFGTYAEVKAALAAVPGQQVLIVPQHILTAVSLGAVFMGANTYIGNGPNFMVRAIASEAGVKMPSFFGYMLWSGCILLPLFFVVGRYLL